MHKKRIIVLFYSVKRRRARRSPRPPGNCPDSRPGAILILVHGRRMQRSAKLPTETRQLALPLSKRFAVKTHFCAAGVGPPFDVANSETPKSIRSSPELRNPSAAMPRASWRETVLRETPSS